MFVRTLKGALEDAHGVIAAFLDRPTPEDDCVPAVRKPITALDATIQHALDRAEDRDTISLTDQRELDERARELLTLWSQCGERTHGLMLDLKTVMGRYVTIAPGDSTRRPNHEN